jgi:hypothetical protein
MRALSGSLIRDSRFTSVTENEFIILKNFAVCLSFGKKPTVADLYFWFLLQFLVKPNLLMRVW